MPNNLNLQLRPAGASSGCAAPRTQAAVYSLRTRTRDRTQGRLDYRSQACDRGTITVRRRLGASYRELYRLIFSRLQICDYQFRLGSPTLDQQLSRYGNSTLAHIDNFQTITSYVLFQQVCFPDYISLFYTNILCLDNYDTTTRMYVKSLKLYLVNL